MNLIPIQTLGVKPKTEDQFVDEEYLPAGGKRQIRQDWQQFIANGFKKLFFTRELYRFLHHNCGLTAHANLETFWAYYFSSETIHLRLFLNQFGGNNLSAEYNTTAWLDGPATDLKQAMCWDLARLSDALLQVLEDLELKHAELGQVWRAFALAGDTPDPGYPPHYLVSENTRNLLAYAAYIALHKPPLRALQRQLPMPQEETYVAAKAA